MAITRSPHTTCGRNNLVAPWMFHVYPLKTLFWSQADDWIVIAKQHCVCALKELRDQRIALGLDTLQ